MTCLICRWDGTVEGFTSIRFQRGEMDVLVNNVPAHICPNCGEAYLEQEVTLELLESLEKIYQAGVPADELSYKSLATG